MQHFPAMPIWVDIADVGALTQMTVETTYPSLAAMEQFLGIGMAEGVALATGQIDEVVATTA